MFYLKTSDNNFLEKWWGIPHVSILQPKQESLSYA